MSETIHIALSFNDPKGTYARHAAVTMVSIFENTSSPICVHVLHDDTLTDFNMDAMSDVAHKYGQSVLFHNIESAFNARKKLLSSFKRLADWGKGTVYRLLLPETVEVDKIIYLDCDILVTLDIAELWNVPIGDKAVACVRDCSGDYKKRPVRWQDKLRCGFMDVEAAEYFNAGVLLMNLGKIRKEYDIIGSLGGFLNRYGRCVIAPDQDYLNWLFSHDKLMVDEKFDRMRWENFSEEALYGAIWHMSGFKPWTLFSRPYVDELYWEYLRHTKYCKSEKELVRLMLRDLSKESKIHRHSSDCIRRLLKQMRENLFDGSIWIYIYIIYKKLTGDYYGIRYSRRR